jgi:hypothetical protein
VRTRSPSPPSTFASDKPAAKRPEWKLSRTAKRPVDFRPIETEDLRYAYAGYKDGALADMAGPFVDTGMDAVTFKAKFQAEVLRRYHGAWTLFAVTARGFIPVGMVFAFHAHFEHAKSPFMIIGDIVWFPWASKRNRIEAAVNFLSVIRKQVPLMDFAHGETNRRFWDVMAKHGIVNRVGTTYNVVRGEKVAIYETRTD